jgi:hypothetical protein
MTRTRIVLRQHDVTGMDSEALSSTRLEFQCAAEGEDKARNGIAMPLE